MSQTAKTLYGTPEHRPTNRKTIYPVRMHEKVRQLMDTAFISNFKVNSLATYTRSTDRFHIV